MMTTGAGSIQYMAPEVFVSAHYTEKSDVYSFAIILWELLSRETPYDKLSQFEPSLLHNWSPCRCRSY